MATSRKVVLASGNPGKLRELQTIIGVKKVEVIPQSDFQVNEIAETGLSFVENALIKARHACAKTGLPSIADDSGIEVDALNGEPGIYSARYAGVKGPTVDTENNARLLSELEKVPELDRTARFQCVIVYLRNAKDPTPLICQGTWEGYILFEQKGKNGFGYDPIFIPSNKKLTFGEMKPIEKYKIDHRYKAFKKIKKFF